MRALKKWMLALRIERKWRRISKNRKRMADLLAGREPYTSPRLVALNQDTARLGIQLRALEDRYRTVPGAGIRRTI